MGPLPAFWHDGAYPTSCGWLLTLIKGRERLLVRCCGHYYCWSVWQLRQILC
jgi:hypothetical protein